MDMASKRTVRAQKAAVPEQEDAENVPSDKLCAKCKSMDIKSFFRGEKRSYGLGLSIDVTRKRNCKLCRFLIEALDPGGCGLPKNNRPDENVPTRCKCTATTLSISSNVKSDETVKYEIRFQVNGGLITTSRPIQILESAPVGQCTPFPEWRGRLVPAVVDTARVQNWLRACEVRHSYRRAGFPSNLRVLDLERKCIVMAPQPCRYVTLSYIWGDRQLLSLTTDNCEFLHKEGNLSPDTEGLAQTIRDAMILTRSINERYLWVDSLCIIQDDDAEKSLQIKAMDRVYEFSALTIVACHGKDANAGLPGVSNRLRNLKQLTCTVEGLRLKLCMPSLKEYVSGTKWMTRGWTYQEELLSNRLLYVTEDQVHFKCKAGCQVCEETSADLTLEPFTYKVVFPWGIGQEDTKDNFAMYADFVTTYTGRDLSNPHDSLNAISGIFNRLQATYGGYPFELGLPTAAFDSALLWEPTRACRRRLDAHSGEPIFPSWTWAGWEGRAAFARKYNSCETLSSYVIWGDGTTHQLRGRESEFQASKWKRYVLPKSCITNYKLRENNNNNEIWYSRPVYAEEISTIRKAIDPGTGHLRFLAETASFTCIHKPDPSPADNPPAATCTLSVLDDQGNHAGTILAVSQILGSLCSGKLDFLALSRTTMAFDTTDPSWDTRTQSFLYPPQERPPLVSRKRVITGQELNIFDRKAFDMYKLWPLYNVLLIEWKEGVAYRLGIGKIHVDAFDPVASRKNIILG
jgi:hypothetical protein